MFEFNVEKKNACYYVTTMYIEKIDNGENFRYYYWDFYNKDDIIVFPKYYIKIFRDKKLVTIGIEYV